MDVFANLFDRLVGCDKLLLRGCIHSVVTRGDCRRTRDAHVHFLGAGVAHHSDDLPAGRATNYRIVDQHDSLTLDNMSHRIQLETYTEIADSLLRLDERAAHVVIANQSELNGDAA